MHASVGQDLPSVDAQPTILLVEDDVLLRIATSDDLRAAGFLVLEAANADETLLVLRGSTAVDAVMTDIRMPGSMDGVRLAEAVRATRPHSRSSSCPAKFHAGRPERRRDTASAASSSSSPNTRHDGVRPYSDQIESEYGPDSQVDAFSAASRCPPRIKSRAGFLRLKTL